jgi:hypothetical protein
VTLIILRAVDLAAALLDGLFEHAVQPFYLQYFFEGLLRRPVLSSVRCSIHSPRFLHVRLRRPHVLETRWASVSSAPTAFMNNVV